MRKAYCDKCKKEFDSTIGKKEIRDCSDEYRGLYDLCADCFNELNAKIIEIKKEGTIKIITLLEKI